MFDKLFQTGVTLRNALYDKQFLTISRVNVPVISVGNISVGGTGKTPMVKWIAEKLSERGYKVGIVSRGYKRSTAGVVIVSEGKGATISVQEGGDEAVLLANGIPDAIVVVAEKKLDAAKKACMLGATCIVIDDGFQHRALGRDIDIVLVSGDDCGKPYLLPYGRLREPFSSLRRAGVVIETKTSDADREKNSQFISQHTNAPVVFAKTVIQEVFDERGTIIPLEKLRNKRFLAVSAIAKPAEFISMLSGYGLTIAGKLNFPDHHTYSSKDISVIEEERKKIGADAVIMTSKDRVKLNNVPFEMYVLAIEFEFDDESWFEKFVVAKLRNVSV